MKHVKDICRKYKKQYLKVKERNILSTLTFMTVSKLVDFLISRVVEYFLLKYTWERKTESMRLK